MLLNNGISLRSTAPPCASGFLDFHKRSQGTEPSLPLILEHDRGTEQQEHFERRIWACKIFLADGGLLRLFGASKATIAFTTFSSSKRVMQMRDWTYQELQDSPQIMGLFIFTELPKPLEPRHLLFERRWYTLTDGQPIALLGGQAGE